MKMLERELEKIFVSEMKKLDGYAYKFVSPGNDGVPDRIAIFPDGRLVFAELKADDGTLSALQIAQIRRLRSLNQDAVMVRGLRGLVTFFKIRGYPEVAASLESLLIKSQAEI